MPKLKEKPWTYTGDLRCPCHRCYSAVSRRGHGDSVEYRMTCRVTGEKMYRDSMSYWKFKANVKALAN